MKTGPTANSPDNGVAHPYSQTRLRTTGDGSVSIVGIGASAGSVEALKQFFAQVPASSECAFVIVMQLPLGHHNLADLRQSQLAELLQPHASMPVMQVLETTPLKADHVYIIGSNAYVEAVDTHLRLRASDSVVVQRAAVDHFFRALAKAHDGHAVGILLSGTGSDGTVGLREIRRQGGLAIAQDPAEAISDEAASEEMPRSAVAANSADLVLPIKDMSAAAIGFVKTEPRLSHPVDLNATDAGTNEFVEQVARTLKVRERHEFSHYQNSVILRNAMRRMRIHHMTDPIEYLRLLRSRAREADALSEAVQSRPAGFFQPPELFEALASSQIPRLFEARNSDDLIRAWCVGCGTGEEAYSLAILLLEESERRESTATVEVLASDLHRETLDYARAALYPANCAAELAPERLRRYFQNEQDGYRLHPRAREPVFFAVHDVLSDPPYLKIDLLICSDFFSLLGRELQQRTLELFYHVLRDRGVLVLGDGEGSAISPLFELEDQLDDSQDRLMILRKRQLKSAEPPLPAFPLTRSATRTRSRPPPLQGFGVLHQRLVERLAPPSVLLDANGNMVHCSAHAGRYLRQPSGEPTTRILDLIDPALSPALRTLMNTVTVHRQGARTQPLLMRTHAKDIQVALDLRPAVESEDEGSMLLIFDEQPNSVLPVNGSQPDSSLETTEGWHLQAMAEGYERAQKEFRDFNEELQCANEELQQREEELRHMFEELDANNRESRHRIQELDHLTADLQNLFAATQIATMFLDRRLCISRFSPKLSDLFNVRHGDIGRPLADFSHRLMYDGLHQDAAQVLDKLEPVEREVQDEAGQWYLMRMLPYRDTGDHVAGAVITFVDITQRKQAEDELKQLNNNKDQFLAMLGHELRNPLAAIRSATELMGLAKTENPTLHRAISAVERQSNHMSRIIDGLLEASRLARGKVQLKRRTIDIRKTLERVIEDSNHRVEAQGLELRTHIAPRPLWVKADEVRLVQVFDNLLGNAIKFTNAPGSITVSAERTDGNVVVRVEDTGTGIRAELLPRIFDSFEQEVQDPARAAGGLGLGLSLAKGLVELHGGVIRAHSEGLGKGTYFDVQLPLTESQLSRPPSSEAEPHGAGKRNKHVLIVEDNPDAAEMLSELLKLRGHAVSAVSTGSEALQFLREQSVDVVLCDIGLPGLSGYEVAAEIRQDPVLQEIPLVALTGYGQPEDRQRSAAAGFDNHLTKPVDLTTLDGVLAGLDSKPS